jgi:hypothetical protein
METLQEIPEEGPTEEEDDESKVITPTTPVASLYEKLLQGVNDPKLSHEVGLSRIGLYKFCGDIGKGNFSRVKKAVHILTKGKYVINSFSPYECLKIALLYLINR